MTFSRLEHPVLQVNAELSFVDTGRRRGARIGILSPTSDLECRLPRTTHKHGVNTITPESFAFAAFQNDCILSLNSYQVETSDVMLGLERHSQCHPLRSSP